MIGSYLMACGLLVLAGASKAVRPGDTVRALTQAFGHQRLLATSVPALAGTEVVLGTAAIIWPRPALAGAVAVSYALFAGFIVVIRVRHGAIWSCGCFGTPDTPATWLHAVINLFLAGSAIDIAVALHAPGGTIGAALSRQPLHGVPLVLAAAVGIWLIILAFTSLAQLTAVRQTLSAPVRARVGESPS
jgi:hypothetical protein